MLKETFITKVAGLLKLDAAKVKAAIASTTEDDIDIADDLTVFNKTELESRDRNTYNNAKKAGEEMLIKGLKTKHGFEFTGEDPDKFIEAITGKVKKELETTPDARLAEMEKTLNTTKRHLKEATEREEGLKSQIGQINSDTELLGLLPNNRLETLTNAQYLTLLKNDVKIENRDGKKITLKNGEMVTDPKTGDPVSPDQVINNIFTERKWIKEAEVIPAGRGGGNSNVGGGFKGKYSKVSQFKDDMKAEKLHENGQDYQRRLNAAMKENPEMDMNS